MGSLPLLTFEEERKGGGGEGGGKLTITDVRRKNKRKKAWGGGGGGVGAQVGWGPGGGGGGSSCDYQRIDTLVMKVSREGAYTVSWGGHSSPSLLWEKRRPAWSQCGRTCFSLTSCCCGFCWSFLHSAILRSRMSDYSQNAIHYNAFFFKCVLFEYPPKVV